MLSTILKAQNLICAHTGDTLKTGACFAVIQNKKHIFNVTALNVDKEHAMTCVHVRFKLQ